MPLSPKVGEKIGRYQLLAELGQGGMAVVYRARDTSLQRDVAIKVMHPHLWGKSEYATRFVREARAVAALQHENIVEIFDFSEGGGGPDDLPGYIVSELLYGPTLREFIDAQGTPLPEVSALIALKLGQALSCAHQQGIIHRDIKPENVIIAEGGRLVLTDFGIARIMEGEAVTQTGAMLGSPAYMSPEQARGGAIDERSDLFSLGSLLYLLCTGKLPFPGKDPISTVLRVLDGKYSQPLQLNQRIGSRLDRIIRRLLQPAPGDRFASAVEVLAALEEFLAESGIGDAGQELSDYFDNPGEYNGRLIPRVIVRSLEVARQAAEEQDFPRALALCDRVIAHEPEHPEALALISSLSARSRGGMGRWLILGGVALALAGGVAYLLFGGQPTGEGPQKDAAAGERPVGLTHGYDAVVSRGGAQDSKPPVDQPRERAPLDLGGRDLRSAPAPSPARRPPRIQRPQRSVDASAPSSPREPDAAAPGKIHADLKVKQTHGELVILIGPWCEAYVDGKRLGDSPRTKPYRVKAGIHKVTCKQKTTGAAVHRIVEVIAGKRSVLRAQVVERTAVQLSLKRGDGVMIRGKTYRKGFSLTPRRYRVTLLKGNQTLRQEYIPIIGKRCTLVDTPKLQCKR